MKNNSPLPIPSYFPIILLSTFKTLRLVSWILNSMFVNDKIVLFHLSFIKIIQYKPNNAILKNGSYMSKNFLSSGSHVSETTTLNLLILLVFVYIFFKYHTAYYFCWLFNITSLLTSF